MIKRVDEFKDRLNKAMAIRNIRAVDITLSTGISEATISQYRSGYAKPKADKLELLANRLNVNPTWLMGLDVPMEIKIETPDPNTDYIVAVGKEKYDIMSEEEKQIILKYRAAGNREKATVRLVLGVDEIPTLDPKLCASTLPADTIPGLNPGIAARTTRKVSQKIIDARNKNA